VHADKEPEPLNLGFPVVNFPRANAILARAQALLWVRDCSQDDILSGSVYYSQTGCNMMQCCNIDLQIAQNKLPPKMNIICWQKYMFECDSTTFIWQSWKLPKFQLFDQWCPIPPPPPPPPQTLTHYIVAILEIKHCPSTPLFTY
jgi:hypothetical protein